MYNNVCDYFVLNNKLVDNKYFKDFEESTCYEVFRVINKRPIFLKEHLDRLAYSMKKMDIGMDIKDIRKAVYLLIEKNESIVNNVKIDVSKDNFRVYYVKSSYPSKDMYKEGVRCITSSIQRDMPTVKKLNMEYKKKIKELLKEDIFEVLLLEDDCFLEGSKSNTFFIKDGIVYTAPKEKILKGITYEKVISIITALNIPIEYKLIQKEGDIKIAFLTGTSIGVLPIREIDGKMLYSSSNKMVHDIMNKYNKLVEEERLK